MSRLVEVMLVYEGSDGEATKALYAELDKLGPAGAIAVNLFRAHKASARAKVYRGGPTMRVAPVGAPHRRNGRGRGSYRDIAYDKKQWAMDNLCAALAEHAEGLGIKWGWGEDRAQEHHRHVLYVELPQGQVSFHTAARGKGPDFEGVWDGVWDGVLGHGAARICTWIARLFDAHAAEAA